MVHVFLSIAFLFGYSSSVQANNFKEALRLGINNSNALRESRQDYLSARQELIIAGSDKDFYGTASISQNQAFYERPNDGDDAYGSSTLSGAITFTKQLYNFGETKAKQDAAAISIDIAKAGFSAAEQSVLISLIQSYLAVILSEEEVDLHQSNYESLTEQTNAEELRVEAGVSTLANLALATSKRSASRSDLISAKAAYQTAVEEYESLIGVLPKQLTTPKLPDLIPAKVQLSENLAYENHPDLFLASARQQLAAIQQEILVKALGPSVDLSLSAKKQNTGGISASDGNELSANISVSVPILVTPATMAQTQKLISDVMSAQYQLDEVKRSIGLAARAAFRNHVAANIQHKASTA
ncbi:MAG: TolC family protein, partial [Alphaproteobacteria bacterium]